MFVKYILSLCVAASLFVTSSAQSDVIVDVGVGGREVPCGGCGDIFGAVTAWTFAVNTPISIDGLGVWDKNGDGIGPSVPVGLWTDAGALLASSTVGDASMPEASAGNGVWRIESIPTLALGIGEYVIGSLAFSFEPTARIESAFIEIPQITVLGGRTNAFPVPDAGFAFPDVELIGGVFPVPVLFGPTARLVQTTISEPGSAFVLAFGLLGLAIRIKAARRLL